MPAVDGCIAVHLRPGKSSVHVMDAGEVAFQTFLALGQAWPWVQHNSAVGPVMNLTRLEKELSPAPRAGTEGEDAPRVGDALTGSASSPAGDQEALRV